MISTRQVTELYDAILDRLYDFENYQNGYIEPGSRVKPILYWPKNELTKETIDFVCDSCKSKCLSVDVSESGDLYVFVISRLV